MERVKKCIVEPYEATWELQQQTHLILAQSYALLGHSTADPLLDSQPKSSH